jgi:Aldo/keto reductase family
MVRSGRRDALVLATKIGAFGGLSRKNIFARVDASLRRLHTDYVDLLYAHLDDPNTPLEETLAAFDEVVRAGRARYIAASNFTPTRLSAAAEVSRRGGFARYVVIQMHYNLLERTQLRIDRLGIAATNPCSVRSVTVRVSPASLLGARAGRPHRQIPRRWSPRRRPRFQRSGRLLPSSRVSRRTRADGPAHARGHRRGQPSSRRRGHAGVVSGSTGCRSGCRQRPYTLPTPPAYGDDRCSADG